MRNKSNYSPDWKEKIRPAVLKRDNYRCVVCGALNHKKGYYDRAGHFVQCDEFMEAWAIRNKIKVRAIHLQIAHLDQDTSNNEMSNLATFCPRHHLAYDKEFNRLKKLSQ